MYKQYKQTQANKQINNTKIKYELVPVVGNTHHTNTLCVCMYIQNVCIYIHTHENDIYLLYF